MRISDWSSDVCSSDLIGSNKHDLQDFAGDRSRHALERSGRPQDARDTFDFLLLSPDEVPDAGHDHLAPIDILDKLVLPRSDAPRVGKECVSTGRSRWSPYH